MQSRSYFDIDPVAGALGAEISRIDISQPLSSHVFAELHQALIEFKVLFFRDVES